MGKKYKFKTRPWRHQVTGLKRALREGTFCLNMEMRTGKTKVALDYIGCQYLWRGADTVLILTTKSVVGRWGLEIHTHLDESISRNLDIRVLNYEQVYGRERWEIRKIKGKGRKTYYSSSSTWEDRRGKIEARGWDVVDNRELMKWARKAARRGRFILVLDESHIVSNASSAIHGKVFKLARMTDMVLELTGTLWHKKPMGIFGQWKMIDPSVFGTRRGMFERMYCIKGGYGNHQVLRWINLDDMARKVAPKVYVVREEDCWDVPRSLDQIVPVQLEESREVYDRLAQDSITELRSGRVVEASLPITLALRLHQVSGGFLRTDSGVEVVGKEKQRALEDLVRKLQDAGRDKIVLLARFRPEVAVCARTAMAVGYRAILFHGGVKKSERDYRIACFEEWREPTVFVSQVATGSMGLELSAARDEIFYSLPNSLVQYDQVRARIRGHKQRHGMTYWHLLADDTVDPAIMLALRENRRLGEMIQAHPEMLKSRFVRR